MNIIPYNNPYLLIFFSLFSMFCLAGWCCFSALTFIHLFFLFKAAMRQKTAPKGQNVYSGVCIQRTQTSSRHKAIIVCTTQDPQDKWSYMSRWWPRQLDSKAQGLSILEDTKLQVEMLQQMKAWKSKALENLSCYLVLPFLSFLFKDYPPTLEITT